jgi:hypothetical protein
VERDGKSLLEWIRIHFLKGLPGLAGPELRFSRAPTASVLRNDACLRLPARNNYVTTCCQNDEPISRWYAKLKARYGQTITDEKIEARKAYKDANKPPRSLKDAAIWLDRWKVVMAQAQTKGVTEASASFDWAMDFLTALSFITF